MSTNSNEASVQSVVMPPRIKLHFDPNLSTFGYWWKEIAFIPPIGTGVVPFDDVDDLDWSWDHDTVKVSDLTYFADRHLLCIGTDVEGDWDFTPPVGLDEAMRKAGWTRGDAMAWQ